LIFATVGTQLPFDRLIKGLDKWAGNHPDTVVIAQTGKMSFKPEYLDCHKSLSPSEIQSYFEKAELVVAHAGMGTILQCLDLHKPLIIMPRKAGFGEHRNDHQLATAEKYKKFQNIIVVENDIELWDVLENPPSGDISNATEKNPNLERLIKEIEAFIRL